MTPSSVPLTALDVALRVTGSDRDLLTELGRSLSDLAADPDEPRPETVQITLSGHGPWKVSSAAHSAVAATREAATGHVHAAVNLGAVAATRLLVFHAAVLAHGQHTLVLPGRSGMGKTTLTAALLMRGWDYVSDEALALPWAFAPLVPYPRPLGLSDWAYQRLGVQGGMPGEGESFVRAAELGSSIRSDPGPVTDLIMLKLGTPAFAEVDVRPAPASDVLAGLLPRAFTAHHDGGLALQILGELLHSARLHTVVVGSPTVTADRVNALVLDV